MKAMPLLDGSACDVLRGEAILANRLDPDSARLCEEFLAMPALSLTVEQVARLLNVPVPGASQLLAALEHDGFLMRTPSRRYRLAEPMAC